MKADELRKLAKEKAASNKRTNDLAAGVESLSLAEAKGRGSSRLSTDLRRRHKAVRKAVVRSDEPLMAVIDAVMSAEGVSDERLSKFLGWGRWRMRDMRRRKSYKQIDDLRLALWALGFEITVRKVGEPFKDLLKTRRHERLGIIRRREFDKRSLWNKVDLDEEEQRAKLIVNELLGVGHEDER